MASSNLVRISGLWIKEGRHGQYFAGKTDQDIPSGSRIIIFHNTKKTREAEPDFTLMISVDEPQQESY